MKPINSHGFSRCWLGVGIALLAAGAAQAQTAVTFQIDMSSISPAPTAVYISGIFNGWPGPGATVNGGFPVTNNILVNVSGTIWSNTFSITDAPGTVESCKFQYDAGGNWEADPNRQFLLGAGTQVLPLTSWNVKDWPAPTNQVTFQIDMNAQVALGNFTPGQAGQTIAVAGDFENWDNVPTPGPDYLTNNPASPGSLSNIFTGTFPVAGFPGATSVNYKFRMNGGWESPASTSGNNRSANVTAANQVLPLVYYNDSSIYDLLLQDTMVTFSLYITNGTWATNFLIAPPLGYQYGSTAGDTIIINGDWAGWDWQLGTPAAQQMVLSDVPNVYTNTQLIPKGHSIQLTYKYGVNGQDDENGVQTNHFRLIRTYANTYTLPTDQWSLIVCPIGTAYPNPGIASTNIVEPDFGYLQISPPAGGNLPVTWLGRPGVLLQNKSALSAGLWNSNDGTDSAQATNWPNAGGNQFFRLMKKQ